MDIIVFDWLILIFCIVLSAQSLLSIVQMLYGWSNPEVLKERYFPEEIQNPKNFFSIIIPCYHEQGIIGKTLDQLSKQTYPKTLFEVLVVVRQEDKETSEEVLSFFQNNPTMPGKLIEFSEGIKRKPRHLNEALLKTKGKFISVFDAEDLVHPQLLEKVNTVIIQNGDCVIQTTITLTNWNSSFYSLHASLEYYIWFHSRLPWFANKGITPLCGTGVFFPRSIILNQHGWEESHLTEDAKIGIDLSVENIPVRVIGEDAYATQEYVPFTLTQFIRQRTRWTLGFFQIFKEGKWTHLSLNKQVYFLSVFLYPIISIIFYLGLVLSIIWRHQMNIVLSLFTFFPLALLLFQICITLIALFEMLNHRKQIHLFLLAVLIFFITYIPYQIVIMVSTLRAIIRWIYRDMSWEKTSHVQQKRVASV